VQFRQKRSFVGSVDFDAPVLVPPGLLLGGPCLTGFLDVVVEGGFALADGADDSGAETAAVAAEDGGVAGGGELEGSATDEAIASGGGPDVAGARRIPM